MKRVEAYFQYGKLENVVEAIEKAGVKGMTVFYARGRGDAERLKLHSSRGTKMESPMFNLIDGIVTVVDDSMVDTVIQTIKKHADTSSKGIIIVSDVVTVVKI